MKALIAMLFLMAATIFIQGKNEAYDKLVDGNTMSIIRDGKVLMTCEMSEKYNTVWFSNPGAAAATECGIKGTTKCVRLDAHTLRINK